MNEYDVRTIVITAPRKASATAVPVIEAASEPLRAMAAVGAMMPTDRAMASMTPSCGRSLLISPGLLSKRRQVFPPADRDCTFRSQARQAERAGGRWDCIRGEERMASKEHSIERGKVH